MKKILCVSIISAFILASCVPARKYQDLESKQKECAEELDKLKSRNADLETLATEQHEKVVDLSDRISRLKGDTAVLGKSLRMKEKQYDKIDALNQRIQSQLEALQKGSAIENQRLMTDLNATRLELQKKEDELRLLEMELNQKKLDLDRLSLDLAAREKRVNELEALIAQKDAAVKALKDKVMNALMGFKDKGLTVVQKNGRVYVSMEAKLLFPSGSTTVNAEGKKALVELAKVLQEQSDLDVLVEGHTDSDKMKSSSHPQDNWELSVLRATSVVKIMLSASSIDPKTITAAGRSMYLPIDENDKAKNRRIEVILTPKLDELFEMISNE
ncbi:OmpA family protein [Flavobacteriales bacterium]|nr:OmpA family protein [Flavobacteriales bacterium]